jgi:maltooligosyltrehalose trehalohydrolase
LAAAAVILSPFLPLLFMGDEYGETAPFQYFVSHSDPELVEAVRRGRREEFASFKWMGDLPDPQDEATFLRSKLNHSLKSEEPHRTLLEFHKELLRLRRTIPALRLLSKENMDVISLEQESLLAVRRWSADNEILGFFNFSDRQTGRFRNFPCGTWHKRFDSSDVRWLGTGTTAPDAIDRIPQDGLSVPPHVVLLYEKGADG